MKCSFKYHASLILMTSPFWINQILMNKPRYTLDLLSQSLMLAVDFKIFLK
jgi:hypothetical protein